MDAVRTVDQRRAGIQLHGNTRIVLVVRFVLDRVGFQLAERAKVIGIVVHVFNHHIPVFERRIHHLRQQIAAVRLARRSCRFIRRVGVRIARRIGVRVAVAVINAHRKSAVGQSVRVSVIAISGGRNNAVSVIVIAVVDIDGRRFRFVSFVGVFVINLGVRRIFFGLNGFSNTRSILVINIFGVAGIRFHILRRRIAAVGGRIFCIHIGGIVRHVFIFGVFDVFQPQFCAGIRFIVQARCLLHGRLFCGVFRSVQSGIEPLFKLFDCLFQMIGVNPLLNPHIISDRHDIRHF